MARPRGYLLRSMIVHAVRLEERAVRESWDEIGHLRGLAHCPDAACVMRASHSLERVDAKTDQFCPACRATMGRAVVPAPGALAGG